MTTIERWADNILDFFGYPLFEGFMDYDVIKRWPKKLKAWFVVLFPITIPLFLVYLGLCVIYSVFLVCLMLLLSGIVLFFNSLKELLPLEDPEIRSSLNDIKRD